MCSMGGRCSPTPSLKNLSLAQLGHGSNIINGGHLWTHCVEKYLTIRCDFGVLKLYLVDLDAFYMERVQVPGIIAHLTHFSCSFRGPTNFFVILIFLISLVSG